MVRDNTGKPVDYIFLEINSSFEALTGLPRDHIIGKKLTEVRPGIEDLSFGWIGIFDQVTAIGTGKSIHFQQYFDQQERWYDVTAYSDQPGYFAVVFRDITENKKTEEELRQREKNFSTLVQNTPDMIVRFNLDLQHIYCNAAVEHQFGVPIHSFIGKTFLEIDGPPEQLKSMHQLLKKALETGKEQQTEQGFPLPSGQKYFQTRIVPERDEKGRIESLLAVTRDITERKQMERELIHSERMAIAGQLAAGVAHEFNNLLSIIGGSAEYAKGIRNENEIKKSLDVIVKSVNRGAQVVKKLLTFTKRIELKKESVDLIEVIEEVVGLVKRDLENNSITVVRNYSDIPKTLIDVG
jgi:PAS domain S-box-containing protein